MDIASILRTTFGATPEMAADPSYPLNKMPEWDSLAHMFFITKLEEEFSIELSGDEILELLTVGDVIRVVESKK